MVTDDAKLAALRERMTDDQRKAMADIIGAELKRREAQRMAKPAKLTSRSSVNSSAVSGSLDREQLGDMYAEMGKNFQRARTRKQQGGASLRRGTLSTAQLESLSSLWRSFTGSVTPGRAALFLGIATLTVLKVVFSGAAVDASIEKGIDPAPFLADAGIEQAALKAEPAIAISPRPPVTPAKNSQWTASEREMLTQLDQRRVELEKRRELLDAREAELKSQSTALNERIAELRTLTARLADTRKSLDARFEERMEQLANVYGSMQPKEAAPLIAKLENPLALSLLERLPAKRLGQILSLMPPDRAVDLTKSLTDRQKVP